MEKKFLAFLLTISVTTGYPEVGYNYRQPIGSVGGGAFGGNLIGGVSSGGFHGGGGGVSIGSSSFGGSGISGGSFGGAGFGSSGGSFGGAGFGSSGGISSGHEGFTSSTSSSSAGYVQRPALIQKHIYVHVPPPEPEEFQQQKQVSFGVPQKHYKIIFIKVPSAPSISQQQISLAAQNQEKTIVYVLVKKPDDFADISAPTIPTTPPSKPEVYFIKYKAQRQTTSTGGEYQHHTGSSGGSIGIGSGGGLSGSAGISSIGAGSGGFAGGNLIGIGGGGGGGIPSTQYGPPGKSGPY